MWPKVALDLIPSILSLLSAVPLGMSHPDSPYHLLSPKPLPGAATNEGWERPRGRGRQGQSGKGKVISGCLLREQVGQ